MHNEELNGGHAQQTLCMSDRCVATERAGQYADVQHACAGEEYLRSTHAQLLRASLLQHDLVQRGAPAPSPGHRQGRSQHGSDRASRFGETRFGEERIFL